jgi:hypothetical protein
MQLYDFIGAVGVGLILAAYFLQTFQWLKEDKLFFALNLIGAALACLASWLIAYWPFVVLEGVWCAVSALGLWRQFTCPTKGS